MATAAGPEINVTLVGGPLNGATVTIYEGQPAVTIKHDSTLRDTYILNPATGDYEYDDTP